MAAKVKWTKVVERTAKKLRKLGCSYSEIARQLAMQGHSVSKQYVWIKLREEGL